MMLQYHELFQPGSSLIGAGCIREIPRFIKRINGKRALVITDRCLAANGIVSKIIAILEAIPVSHTVYQDVVPNPTIQNVEEATNLLHQDNCDFLVAIGGGSPQDVAKAVGILATNGGKIEDYEGADKSCNRSLPLFAINTTAGTGSEATRAYVITNPEKKIKMLMVDSNCLATVAFNDPLLMVEMPPALTAATGMDALTHAVEAYLSKRSLPYGDALSLESIRLIGQSLRAAVADGSNIEARTNMCWAEFMAGLAFSNAGLGLVHAMAHQLGGFYNIPHGVANAILLPYAMRYNISGAKERYGRIAEALGENTDGLSPDQASEVAVRMVKRLSDEIGIPPLRSTAFSPKDIATLALNALQDIAMADNPREVSLVDVQEIFMNAYEG